MIDRWWTTFILRGPGFGFIRQISWFYSFSWGILLTSRKHPQGVSPNYPRCFPRSFHSVWAQTLVSSHDCVISTWISTCSHCTWSGLQNRSLGPCSLGIQPRNSWDFHTDFWGFLSVSPGSLPILLPVQGVPSSWRHCSSPLGLRLPGILGKKVKGQ